MARQRSELLSTMGTNFEILKAITDAVLHYGGNDDDIRRILRVHELPFDIAAAIMAVHQSYVMTVDFDDPKWAMYPFGAGYTNHGSGSTSEGFPVRHRGKGKCQVTVGLNFNDLSESMTIQGRWNRLKEKGAPDLDIAITDAFITTYPHVYRNRSVFCLCGEEVLFEGDKYFACIKIDVGEPVPAIWRVRKDWQLSHLLLYVKSIEPIG